MQITTYNSPIGKLYIATADDAVVAISDKPFSEDYFEKLDQYPTVEVPGGSINNINEQLDDYFSGKRQHFDLEMELHGTNFQQAVWKACASIPYGETRSYADLANMIGKPQASRAVGMALGANPIPIVIPCHRVIGSSGKLTGFGGGLDVKKALLELEGIDCKD